MMPTNVVSYEELKTLNNASEILCLLNYILMGAAEDPDTMLRVGDLALLYRIPIEKGFYPFDVAEDLDMPIPLEWKDYMG